MSHAQVTLKLEKALCGWHGFNLQKIELARGKKHGAEISKASAVFKECYDNDQFVVSSYRT